VEKPQGESWRIRVNPTDQTKAYVSLAEAVPVEKPLDESWRIRVNPTDQTKIRVSSAEAAGEVKDRGGPWWVCVNPRNQSVPVLEGSETRDEKAFCEVAHFSIGFGSDLADAGFPSMPENDGHHGAFDGARRLSTPLALCIS
jgi:hypothetical protein